MKRSAILLAALTPSLALLSTAHCSSSSSKGGGSTYDPGATFGMEVAIRVTGAGRVVSEDSSINCPSDCQAKLIVESRDASKTMTLKAEASNGWRFVGWAFSTPTVGTRGKGPEACQPITRPASAAPEGSALGNPTLVLAPGETQGTPQASGGPQCVNANTVPIAYAIEATFIPDASSQDAGTDAPIDASEDAPLDAPADVDAGDPPIYLPTVSGAKGGKIYARSSRVYWQTDVPGSVTQSMISMGYNTGGSITELGPLGTFINSFFVGPTLNFQRQGSGVINVSSLTGSSTNLLTSSPACNATASDSSYTYCRDAAGNVYRWTSLSGSSPTLIASGLPNGPDLGIDTSYLFFSDTSGTRVRYIPNSGVPDAGPDASPTLNDVATGQMSPRDVVSNGTYAFWIADPSGTPAVLQAPRLGGNVTTLLQQTGIKAFAVDSSHAFILIVPSSSPGAASIARVTIGGGLPTTVRSGLTDPGGIATDGSSYIYYTGNDGRVFRIPRL